MYFPYSFFIPVTASFMKSYAVTSCLQAGGRVVDALQGMTRICTAVLKKAVNI
jgi:hypothetical protein